jgi:hypothetical protein
MFAMAPRFGNVSIPSYPTTDQSACHQDNEHPGMVPEGLMPGKAASGKRCPEKQGRGNDARKMIFSNKWQHVISSGYIVNAGLGNEVWKCSICGCLDF